VLQQWIIRGSQWALGENTSTVRFSWQIDFQRAVAVVGEPEIEAGSVRGKDSDPEEVSRSEETTTSDRSVPN